MTEKKKKPNILLRIFDPIISLFKPKDSTLQSIGVMLLLGAMLLSIVEVLVVGKDIATGTGVDLLSAYGRVAALAIFDFLAVSYHKYWRNVSFGQIVDGFLNPNLHGFKDSEGKEMSGITLATCPRMIGYYIFGVIATFGTLILSFLFSSLILVLYISSDPGFGVTIYSPMDGIMAVKAAFEGNLDKPIGFYILPSVYSTTVTCIFDLLTPIFKLGRLISSYNLLSIESLFREEVRAARESSRFHAFTTSKERAGKSEGASEEGEPGEEEERSEGDPDPDETLENFLT